MFRKRKGLMKTAELASWTCLLALALGGPAFAKDKIKVKEPGQAPPRVEKSGQASIHAKVVFSPSERDIIHTYVKSCTVAEGPGKKPKGLPPGLAKKVARGGELPPGWQKKCVRGQIMPKEVFKVCHPLPRELVVKLPPPPPGTILVTIEGKVVRLAKATLEILDVFDVL